MCYIGKQWKRNRLEFKTVWYFNILASLLPSCLSHIRNDFWLDHIKRCFDKYSIRSNCNWILINQQSLTASHENVLLRYYFCIFNTFLPACQRDNFIQVKQGQLNFFNYWLLIVGYIIPISNFSYFSISLYLSFTKSLAIKD